MKRFFAYQWIRFPIASVLVFAALTKAYQTATEPSDGIPWIAMGIVFFEMLLGTLLFSGVWQRRIKWATIAVFTVFFCVAVDLALKSVSSCGCFGSVPVDPRITAGLDAIIVLLLLLAPTARKPEFPTRKQLVVILSGMLSAVLLFPPMLLHPPIQRTDHGMVVSETTQDTENPKQEPPLSGLVPPEVQLGYVESKSVHRFALEIVNPTNEDWNIDSIETECICIAVIEQPESVAAKGKSPIMLEFTVPDLAGPYMKTITIVSGEQTWTTRFHARIDTPIAIEPESLTFSIKAGIEEVPLTIRNDGTTPVRLLYATASPPVCTVKIGVDPIPPGEELSLPVRFSEAEVGQTIFLSIHTNHRQQKILRIPIQVVE